MKSGVARLMASLALGGLLAASVINGSGCDDDDTTTGAGGASGTTGVGGIGGIGGRFGFAGIGGGGGATDGVRAHVERQ